MGVAALFFKLDAAFESQEVSHLVQLICSSWGSRQGIAFADEAHVAELGTSIPPRLPGSAC